MGAFRNMTPLKVNIVSMFIGGDNLYEGRIIQRKLTYNADFFHSTPLKVLKSLAEKYPETQLK